MKNYFLLIFLATAFLFNSCIHNFEEGADISLRSINRRIEGKWRIKGVWVNGIDSTTYPPYSQYTQKDSLTLTFIFNEPFGPDKVNYLESSVGQQRRTQTSLWGVDNSKKLLEVFNLIYGFNTFFYSSSSSTYWKIVCCRNNRLVLDLDHYYLAGNAGNKRKANKRILLIAA